MPGFYIFILCLGLLLLIGCIICFSCADDKQDVLIEIGYALMFVSIICFIGFGYGAGLKHGSEMTAKGKYTIEYTFDKDGKPCDTIVNWHHM
jgi:hypothetical protein